MNVRAQAAARAVARAWNNPGPVPEVHRDAQYRLGREWPALAVAVNALAETIDDEPEAPRTGPWTLPPALRRR